MTPKGRALEKVRRHAGGKAKFRIRVTNMGTDAARNVLVCDLLPKQFKLIKASVKVTFRNGRPCVRLPLLKGQRQGFITVRIAKTAKGTVTNVAAVSARDSGRRRNTARCACCRRERRAAESPASARPRGGGDARGRGGRRRGRCPPTPSDPPPPPNAPPRPPARAPGSQSSSPARPPGPTRGRVARRGCSRRSGGGPAARSGCSSCRVRGDWVQVRLPNRPNRAAAWVSADRVVLRPTRWRVEIDVGARQVSALRDGRVGAAVRGRRGHARRHRRRAVASRSTRSTGSRTRSASSGPVALHLTAHSNVLDDYGGGPGRVALHGRGGASLLDPLGSAASHGCIRVDSGQAAWLSAGCAPASRSVSLTPTLVADAAERPRPVPDPGGLDRRGRARQHARPRAAVRAARLPPLLAGRAPRRPDARRAEPGGADRPRSPRRRRRSGSAAAA